MSIYLSTYLPISLSLYIYIYIYMTCFCISFRFRPYTYRRAAPRFQAKLDEGAPYVYRFRVPQERAATCDHLYGDLFDSNFTS